MVKHTMQDVARLAAVSVSTVSAVINGTARVSEVRSKRVLAAMEALDFHPDQVARSLRVGKTKIIGVIVPDITNAFYPEVVRGIEDAARESGYCVVLCNTNEDPGREQCHLSTLFSRRVDGVLLACSDSSTAYDSLIRRRYPLVFMDRIPKGAPSDAVCTDNVQAAGFVTQHLIELGHTRIASLAGNPALSSHGDRVEGFRKAMQSAGLPVLDEYLCVGGLRVEDGHRAAKQLLSLRQPPTAIIASNNKLLLGLLKAVHELEVRCPEQLSIAGFDDHPWNEHFTPSLTVVVQQTYQLGRKAFELLLAKMTDSESLEEKRSDTITLLKAELHVRDSTAPPPPDYSVELQLDSQEAIGTRQRPGSH